MITNLVLCHKIRESIQLARAEGALQGDVEIDLVFFGGYQKPENNAEDRKDRRLKENQSNKRLAVIVAREKKGRTVTLAAKREADGVAFVGEAIKAGSTVYADEASCWDQLAANFPIKRVNHQVCYSAPDGTNTNMVRTFDAWCNGPIQRRNRRCLARRHAADSEASERHDLAPTPVPVILR